MKIQAKKNASQRVKSRLGQHGPDFEIVQTPMTINGRICVLIKNDNYLGWMPVDEIEIENG